MEIKKLGKVKSQSISFPVAFGIDTFVIYQSLFKRDLGEDLKDYSENDHIHSDLHRTTMQMVYAFAKTANPKIKKPNKWIKQFRGHDPQDMFNQVAKLMDKEVG